MAITLAIRRRRARDRLGIGMPGDNSRIIELARSLRDRIDAAVIGGIAVYLHGVSRATVDLDLYTTDRKLTARQLEGAGAKWDGAHREHILRDIPIHTISPEEAGHVVRRTSVIDGVRVVSLKDLVIIKLICGLRRRGRSGDLGDVEDLIRTVPLDKRFAGGLPRGFRSRFKAMVDAVRADEGSRRKDRF